MRIQLPNVSRLLCLFLLTCFIQQAQAQKEIFFNHFYWNRANLTPAGSGIQGFNLNSLYRNYQGNTNHYASLDIPLNRLHSAIGVYYLHNSTGSRQSLQTGLSYTAFVKMGYNSSLRLGLLGKRHQQAYSAKTWAFREYRTETVYYSADASLFLQRDKLELGLTVQNLYPKGLYPKPDYNLMLSFFELRASSWLRSSPAMLLRIRHGQQLPEWRFNYTATIGNFLLLGSSYYKNSAYLFGFNAGFKLFNGIWLTAATDFEELQDMQRSPLALYEFGLRMNFNRKENLSNYTD
jgi:hypothetical protein